jgi:integrase
MGRRGHGEGTIYQRADGKWTASISLGYADGKRKRKQVYGKTRREVAEKLTAVQHDVQQGLPVVTERQTVEQFLNRWLEDSVKPTVRPKTYQSYAQMTRLHIVPSIGRVELTKLSPQQVQAWLNRKMTSGLAPRTVSYMRSILRQALEQACRWGLVARNVAKLIDPPAVPQHEMKFLSPVQARQLMAAAAETRFEALIYVALLGLRQGEILGLRWSDIDLEAGTLQVRHQLQRIDGQYRLVEPKSEKGRRMVSLPAFVMTGLRGHRARQLQDRLLAGAAWQGEAWDLVFCTQRGTPLEARNLLRDFKKLLERASLPDMRFHDLRHSAATLLLAKGVPERVVMEILGHSQLSQTMRYSHVIPKLQQEAARKLDELLTGEMG